VSNERLQNGAIYKKQKPRFRGLCGSSRSSRSELRGAEGSEPG